MCVWNCGWSDCVCESVLSVMCCRARSFWLANPSRLWPDYCLSLHPPIPLSFWHSLILSLSSNFPPPISSLFSFSVFITLCWWFCYSNGEEEKISWLLGRHVCALSYHNTRNVISQTPWERHMFF